MKDLAELWNNLANPKLIPRLFSLVLGIILLIGLLVPMNLNDNQLYTRPAIQEQINENNSLAPYDRGGIPLLEDAYVKAQYPNNSRDLGKITAYLSPLALMVKNNTIYFGTSICASPGGILDEILYYTRGFDTILESSILMMAFVIASWVGLNFTMRREDEE